MNSEIKSIAHPDEMGFYGRYGGAFVPEILVPNLQELKENYKSIIRDEKFSKKYNRLLEEYVGRPSPLYYSESGSRDAGCKVFFKREDLVHTGSHKINNALGQVLLAAFMGKKEIIAETGAGQHGVAVATACCLLGLPCKIFMGSKDVERQAQNVNRMKLLKAKVIPATSGSKSLKDATNEAIRYWICNPESSYYVLGSVVGPDPYPDLVASLQSVIGKEIMKQFPEKTGKKNPDYIIACIGGGSNAAGAFLPFVENDEVNLVGVEAAGKGLDSGETAASLKLGTAGIIHGFYTRVLQNSEGQIQEAHSVSAGLDYPGVGPLHAMLDENNRANYISVTDREALEAGIHFSSAEGILPALESAHAIAGLKKMKFKPDDHVVVVLSGRGEKDLTTYLKYLNYE